MGFGPGEGSGEERLVVRDDLTGEFGGEVVIVISEVVVGLSVIAT